MKKVALTIVLLLISFIYSNAQWQQFSCSITGDNDFAHTSSVINHYIGIKHNFNFFRTNHTPKTTNLNNEEPLQSISEIEIILEYNDSGHIPIKSYQSNILKRRE